MRTNWICGISSGLAIYIVSSCCSLLPYCELSGHVFTGLFITSIIIGAIIAVAAVTYSKPTVASAILRSVILFLSYGIIMGIGGFLGIMRSLIGFLNPSASSAADNVSGMMILTFLTVLLMVCIVAIAVLAVARLLWKRSN